MAKIVMTLESVLIAGSHFDANTLVNCDDSDAAQLISIKRAREATPEEVKEAREKAKKNDVAKQAPKPIGAEDTESATDDGKDVAEKEVEGKAGKTGKNK
jgi:hypothetical protein